MVKLICLLLLLIVGTADAQRATDVVVSGRVVDEEGKPTSNAEVCIEPVVYPARGFDRIIECVKSSVDGRFNITKVRKKSVETRYFLFVASYDGKDSYPLVTPPFDELRLTEASFEGLSLTLGSVSQVDVGNVPINFYYGDANLLLSKEGKKRIPWSEVYVKVMTKGGSVARFRTLSNFTIGAYVRDNGTCLRVSLPAGEWKVELVDIKTELSVAESEFFQIARNRTANVKLRSLQ